ncbi:S1 RNA-binding domain-containing protein [Agitococcus lubricus]|uniref:S1 motif domain-containing protein n=1 Tax=Agitococcus lubricus TaxID=1077255 RepID=A0A2T5IWH5_9GAMM|nr:S1-like domain-containing RNA-binding protein [Agitococcus lubricus]PTQ88256.1 hypothetical protein C8N29_11322 [Agitococcus lubricus]
MIHIGQRNRLTIIDQTRSEYFLDGGSRYGDIPINKSSVLSAKVGQEVEVFLYIDDDGYLAATTTEPFVEVGQAAYLKVLAVEPEGAWLDWGLEAPLFLPRKEQQYRLETNRHCLIYVLYDEKQGLIASTYLNDFIKDFTEEFTQGQEVSILVAQETELGYKVIVNHRFWGILYQNEIFKPISKGETLTAYVKRLRTDHRLDVSLTPLGFAKVNNIVDDILAKLAANKGFLALSDKSSPELIYDTLGVSKKVYKQAIGTLFKQRRIIIEDNGIRLAAK